MSGPSVQTTLPDGRTDRSIPISMLFTLAREGQDWRRGRIEADECMVDFTSVVNCLERMTDLDQRLITMGLGHELDLQSVYKLQDELTEMNLYDMDSCDSEGMVYLTTSQDLDKITDSIQALQDFITLVTECPPSHVACARKKHDEIEDDLDEEDEDDPALEGLRTDLQTLGSYLSSISKGETVELPPVVQAEILSLLESTPRLIEGFHKARRLLQGESLASLQSEQTNSSRDPNDAIQSIMSIGGVSAEAAQEILNARMAQRRKRSKSFTSRAGKTGASRSVKSSKTSGGVASRRHTGGVRKRR